MDGKPPHHDVCRYIILIIVNRVFTQSFHTINLYTQPHGRAFKIRDKDKLISIVLPKYFV